jgi:DNA-binding transcriptional regulator YiaG
MADSSYWRKLADEFRALPLECKGLRADRYPITDETDEIDYWELDGTSTATALFDALARRAAIEIPDHPSTDLLTTWLEALVKRGGVILPQAVISKGKNPDGTPRPTRTIGSLYHVSEESANFCKKLESEALQAEAEEKQSNDPRSWPPLRAEFEVFKSLRDMQSGPREEIPEALVRDSLSRQLRIKPEEVTWEQIRHAVLGLLPHYKAITLMPTSGSQLDPHRNLRRKRKRKRKRKPSVPKETIAEQIQRLRKECNLTVEQLAALVGLDVRNVSRHVSGRTKPRLSSLAAYERVFSKALDRKVTIDKTP